MHTELCHMYFKGRYVVFSKHRIDLAFYRVLCINNKVMAKWWLTLNLMVVFEWYRDMMNRWYVKNWLRMEEILHSLVVEEMVNRTVWGLSVRRGKGVEEARSRGEIAHKLLSESLIFFWICCVILLCHWSGSCSNLHLRTLLYILENYLHTPAAYKAPPQGFSNSIAQVSDVFHQGLDSFKFISIICVRSFLPHHALKMTF